MMFASSTCASRTLGAARSVGLAGGGFRFLTERKLSVCFKRLSTSHSSRSSSISPTITRFKSTAAAASADKCPYHNSEEHNVPRPPKLVEVPALPFVGSLIPQYSGIAEMNLERPYEFWSGNRKKFGDFYQMGMPGFGVGLFARSYILTDANEFMKVLRQEGPFPFGAVQGEWPLIQYFHSVNSALMDKEGGYFGQGEMWKRQRRFLQTDLLSPAAARGYVPGMIKAAQEASKGVTEFTSDINDFMARSSFDMFSSIMFGEFTGVANPKSNPDTENAKFCVDTVSALEGFFPLMIKPHLKLPLMFGIKPAEYKEFEMYLDASRNTSMAKVRAFRKKKEEGTLNETERASYFALAIDRQKAEPGSVSDDELAEIGSLMLSAAIDTTSSILNWCIVHLAMNQEVQQKLFEEVSANVMKSESGELSEAMLSKAAAPYLHAVIRENHRMTPAVPISLTKDNAQGDVEVHGVTIPKGNRFTLDAYSIGMDPEYVPDYQSFRPERWLDDEVQARAGTPAEMIDHPLYRAPFSAGSRKCPGSRVANYETLVMISQLLLDWKISIADDSIKSLKDVKQFQGLTVQPKVPTLKVQPRA